MEVAQVARIETSIVEPVSLVYVDPFALTRDCFARQLTILLPELSILSFSSAFDVGPRWPCARPGCVILQSHSAGADDPGVAEDLGQLRQLLSGVPIVLLSNMAGSDNAVHAVEAGATAYIPTSLPMRAVAEAIRLVLAGCSIVPAASVSPTKPTPDV